MCGLVVVWALMAVLPLEHAAGQDGLRAEWYWESGRLSRLSSVDWDSPDLETNEAQINWGKTRNPWFSGAPRSPSAASG